MYSERYWETVRQELRSWAIWYPAIYDVLEHFACTRRMAAALFSDFPKITPLDRADVGISRSRVLVEYSSSLRPHQEMLTASTRQQILYSASTRSMFGTSRSALH